MKVAQTWCPQAEFSEISSIILKDWLKCVFMFVKNGWTMQTAPLLKIPWTWIYQLYISCDISWHNINDIKCVTPMAE